MVPGCRFAGRCPFATDECHTTEPALRKVASGHRIACRRVSDDGPVMYAVQETWSPPTNG
ncbi:hypothetical protein EBZ70_01285 [bacterium]|nr:hypothetical protein [bacterium]